MSAFKSNVITVDYSQTASQSASQAQRNKAQALRFARRGRSCALWAVSAVVVGASFFPASAQTYDQQASATFTVNLTIEADCTIAADPLDFGLTGVLNSNLDAESSLNVTCTNTTPYTVGLDAGDVTGSTVADRLMQNTGAGEDTTVAYQLYQDSARATVWGDTPDTDTVGGVGTGSAQTIPVYGRVPPQDTPGPGTYQATITATVYF